MSVESIAQRAAYALHTTDKSLFKPLTSISAIPCSESSTLHLLAVSQAGGRGMGVGQVWVGGILQLLFLLISSLL